MQTVSFTRMIDGTKEDYEFLDKVEDEYKSHLPERVIQALKYLDDSVSAYKISRLEHSLQGATRAHRAGESEEYVLAVLLHDIGDHLAPYSHSELAAAVLRPFVSDRIYWIVKHHGLFQMYYYAHHSGGDRNARDRFRDHEWYADAVRFCEEYDQNCFDPAYDNEPLSFFEPMVQRVFAQPRLDDSEHTARYGHVIAGA